MKSGITGLLCLGLLAATWGCTQQPAANSETAQHDKEHEHAQDGHGHHDHDHEHDGAAGEIEAPVAPSEEGQRYVLAEAPADAQGVIDARKSLKNDDDVVVTGRIGGSHNPWIDGRAIFTLVDDSLKSCNQIPGDQCPAPWDYCCETEKLPEASALVKVVDENGQPIKKDARELLGVRELTEVVVKGKAQRDDAGNLTVLANSVYVKK